MADPSADILDHLTFLYGENTGQATFRRLESLMEQYRSRLPEPRPARLSERDAVLITYGDMVRESGKAPLHALANFLQTYVEEGINVVHILPFYPYSSDDGFSVIDYKAVNPELGDWEDVARIGQHFRLMFDAVINHISAQSAWFQAFLRDDPQYRDYFVTVDPGIDLSQVFRPRALPLLTPVKTAAGEKLVWTTFSDDQIDLNYKNPDVLLDILDVLLFYVAHGAEFIRLDAIAFMWKEPGTTSIHLPQTHRIIQLVRSVLDVVAPQVFLITETNVPHSDNVSYFGSGYNEAQMVYNFSLPPLTLHAFHSGDATTLSQWASEALALPSDRTTFFNFLASHDGIGVTPARGVLSDAAINAMAQRVQALGGYVSYKNNPDGTQSAYELNINYLDALGNPDAPEEDLGLKARRFLATQAVMLALRGVPGIYFHSLFGSRSWQEGVEQTGRYRSINRQKLMREQLEHELAAPGSLRHRVFYAYLDLLQKRKVRPAFHPNGGQQVVFCH
ncbi:MAG TPA: sugar phosphorylase, partial [Anaerolineae bacterium]